jgi:phage terminase small subunit
MDLDHIYRNARKKKRNKREKIEQKERLNKQKSLKLTQKQELFCQYYLKNFNATLAYVKAYGCDYDSALASGPRLLGDVRVKQEIQRLKEIKKNSIMLDKDDIVERYMRIAFADMTDFVEWGTYEKLITNELGEPVLIENEKTGKEEYLKEKRNRIEFKDSNLVDGGLICQIKQGKDGATVKLEDRQKALEWLSKYFLMNPLDKHKIEFDNKKLAIEEKRMNKDNENKSYEIKIGFEDDDEED